MTPRESKIPRPTLDEERKILDAGHQIIVGVDEAGRGSLFGPVCVGMIALPLDDLDQLAETLHEVRDSKQISRPKVYRLAQTLKELFPMQWAVGHATAKQVDEFGIVGAIKIAAEQALELLESRLEEHVQFLLTDSRMPKPSNFNGEQQQMVHGDAKCLSIACAAILAKADHDERVRKLAEEVDADYQIENNVGYGTAAHRNSIERLGRTTYHRRTFLFKQERANLQPSDESPSPK